MRASKALKEVIKSIGKESLKTLGTKQDMIWELTAAEAPWMNGVTESLVKSVKVALGQTIGEQVLEFSTLQTVLFEAAELVNSRPIGRHPTDPDEGVYLSPNDLLLGRSSSRPPRGPFLESSGSKRRYECIQRIIDGFWKKWNRDFFPSILVRQKWHVENRNLEVGDIVAIQNKEAKRGQWKLGRVMDVHLSLDGYVRKATVGYKINPGGSKYQNKDYTCVERPARNLVVLLPVDEGRDESELVTPRGGSETMSNKSITRSQSHSASAEHVTCNGDFVS